MNVTQASEPGHGREKHPRQFSVVFAPAATVAVQKQNYHAACNGGVLMRHLCAPQQPQHGRDLAGSSCIQPASRLSKIVLVVRAQPCSLHLYRGRKLCRVVEFPSPVVDITGLPWGSSAAAASTGTLCMAACRDGTAYALPVAEVLEAAEPKEDTMNRGRKSENKSVGGGSRRDVDGAPSGAGERKQQRSLRSSSSSAAAGIFDDLAPFVLDESHGSPSPKQSLTQQYGQSTAGGRGGGGTGESNYPAGVATVGDGSFGGLVMQAREQWAIFTHPGARTVAACSDGAATAVAGIINCAALYDVRSETPTAAGRHLGTLDAIDGAAPTMSCTVWMGGGSNGDGALGDGKGFPLSSPVFRSLFGAELSRRGPATPSRTPRPTRPSSTPCVADSKSEAASVVLVGDRTGTVRWSPVPPLTGVAGGIFACLPGEKTAVVATLPQLDAESRAIGVLVVGANGAVLSLTTTAVSVEPFHNRGSRKRPRADGVEANGGSEGGESRAGGVEAGGVKCTTAMELRGSASSAVGIINPQAPPRSVYRRRLGLPFPVDAACSVPGFLVHCHAGALFATVLPNTTEGHEETGPTLAQHSRPPKRLELSGVSSPALPLRPVRLPLPCDTVGVAVAPVLTTELDGADTTSSDSLPTADVLRTLVLSLSARGRLVGFMAPQSAEELEGWSLDTGKGGVRVGGSAGVERRVRCQLERLSSLGRQCAALSAESAERDREIRILRGATVLLPPLAAARVSQRRLNGNGGAPASCESLGHSVSMGPDTQETGAEFADLYGGGSGAVELDALRVRLWVRLWPRDGGRAREELQTIAEDHGAGRWFIVTRIIEGGGGRSSSGDVSDDAENVGEGWAWSTSASAPMGFLCQGWPWRYSVALTLPSARPVTVSSWLQFRFRAGDADDDGGGDGDGTLNGGGEQDPLEEAAGVCVELGSSRFDILDWGVKLPSVPRSTAAIRAAARGRGSIFCGPELAIADVFGRCSSVNGGVVGGGGGGNTGGGLRATPTEARPAVPAAWSSFRLRVASPDRDAGALLALLVPPLTYPPPTSDRDGGGDGGGGGQGEVAIRVAGQVAIFRATDCSPMAAVGGGFGGRARAAAGTRPVEVAVACSHAAMAPLVREALLSRAGALLGAPPNHGRRRESDVGDCGGGGGGGGSGSGEECVRQQGDAAARLVRAVYPLRQAVVDVGDAARLLGTERANDGPSAKTAEEALTLMYRVGEIYQRLRRQQEAVGLLL